MTTEEEKMTSEWQDVRGRRKPRAEQVAAHRSRLEGQVRAYRLREVREEQGLTQVELAARMHVSQPSVSALERGDLDRAGLSTVKAYVEALGGHVEIIAEFGDNKIVLA